MDGGERRPRGGYDDKMIMNQIMLRFRPIAPKPAGDGGSASGYSDPENKRKDMVVKKRIKRKYVRVKKSCVRKDNHKGKESADWIGETVVTLELLPEIGKRFEEGGISKDLDYSGVQQLPSLMSLNMAGNNFRVSDLMVVESSVTVLECLTERWGELEGGLGCTDEEKVRNLEVDTCPGFVSDGVGGVRWVNRAYRRMVGASGEAEVVVWLAVKEWLPVGRGGFSCRVRVVYGKEKQTQTVPCDVWSMEFGGFAWRLDVQAALSLGR